MKHSFQAKEAGIQQKQDSIFIILFIFYITLKITIIQKLKITIQKYPKTLLLFNVPLWGCSGFDSYHNQKELEIWVEKELEFKQLNLVYCNQETFCKQKITLKEFLLWLSKLRTQLVSMRMQVQFLTSLSGLRIQHCHELQCRSQMLLRSVFLWLWHRLTAAAPI